MNIFATQLTADNSRQNINDKLDISKVSLNIGSNAGYDKLTFDSLLTNLKAEKIVRTPSQFSEYRTEAARSNSSGADRNRAVEDQGDMRRSDEAKRRQGESERKTDADNSRQEFRSGDISERRDYKEAEPKVESGDRDSTTLDNTEAVQQSYTSVNIDGPEPVEGAEIKANAGEPQDSLKTGDHLGQLLQGIVEESLKNKNINAETAETAVKGEQNGNGLKIGHILAALVNGKAEEDSKSHPDHINNNDNAKTDNAGAMKFENSVLSSEKQNKAPEMKIAAVNDETAAAQIKPANPEADTAEAEIEELLKRVRNNGAEKKVEIKQEHLKDAKIQEYVEAKGLQESSNLKISANKINPGLVESLIREGGTRINADNAPKTVHVQSDSGNLESSNGVDVKGEGGKVNTVMTPGPVAKPSAFAEVVNKVVYVAKGEKTLGITVDHKDLGKINIKLSLDKGMVNVHINTADKAVREFVESNMQQIVESLSKSGVSVGGFSVGLKHHQNREGYGNANGGRNERIFPIDGLHEKEYIKAASNVYAGSGRVSILA